MMFFFCYFSCFEVEFEFDWNLQILSFNIFKVKMMNELCQVIKGV